MSFIRINRIFLKIMKTQYRQQFRWLLFLLIPFIIQAVILFLIPYYLSQHNLSLLQQSYNNQNRLSQQILSRSLSIQSTSIIYNRIRSYQNLLSTLSGFIETSTNNYISVDANKIILNNAFQFSNRVVNSNLSTDFTEKQSSWFATNASSEIQLSAAQTLLLQQFKSIDPFIISQFPKNDSIIKGIITQAFFNNTSLVLQFPSRFRQQYTDLETPLNFFTPLTSTLENYQNTNGSQQFMVFTQYSDQQLEICNVLFDQQQPIGVACLILDTQQLEIQLLNSLQFSNLFTTRQYKLVRPVYSSVQNETQPKIIFCINEAKSFYINQSYFNNLQQFGKQIWSSQLTEKTKSTFIYKQSQHYFITNPIIMSDHRGFSNILFFLILINTNKDSDISQDQNFISSLNNLIIPVVITICIIVLTSFFILNKLLKNMDKETFKINTLCIYIISGDLDINVPKFSGVYDINKLYGHLRDLNQIHRYTSSDYFSGHFANKIFKYNEAIEFFKKLGYNTAFLNQNIGEVYLYAQDCEKSIQFLTKAVNENAEQFQQKYGKIEDIYFRKLKNKKMSNKYKEDELLLIRRIWKLIFTYFNYNDLQSVFQKNNDDMTISESQRQKKKEKIAQKLLYYLDTFKKLIHPDYQKFSELIIATILQIKQHLTLKQLDKAKECIINGEKLNRKYGLQYQTVKKKIQQKSTKNKLLVMRNKMGIHSLSQPQINNMFIQMMKAKYIMITKPKPQALEQTFSLLIDACKGNAVTMSLNFMLISELRKILIGFGIDNQKFQSTQLFNQSIPLKKLFYGDLTTLKQPQIYKLCTKVTPGLERQFIYMFDVGVNEYLEHNKAFTRQKTLQKANYLYDKYIKGTDRISLVKYNTRYGVKTEFNLTLKQVNNEMMRRQLNLVYNEHNNVRKNQIFEAIGHVIKKIKFLQCEKIVLVYFKSLGYYKAEINKRIEKKRKISEEKENSSSKRYSQRFQLQQKKFKKFGNYLVEQIQNSQIRNCKLMLFPSVDEKLQKFIQFFGLKNINRRVWSNFNQKNINNNIVYIIEEKYSRNDIDRILMLKTRDIPDNHLFIL